MVSVMVWIVWYVDAQMAARIHTDNSPEMTHLSVRPVLTITLSSIKCEMKMQNLMKTTAENEGSVQWEEKLSNQSVAKTDCVNSENFSHFILHFTRCQVRTFTFRILYSSVSFRIDRYPQ